MRILILGGTVFLGRALIDAARTRGHTLTLFNRGRSGPDLYPDIETLRGDRGEDLSALDGRSWDAVIDTCAYVPRVAAAAAAKLADAVGHYTIISSVSVYADTGRPGIDEQGAVGTLDDASVEEVTGETYGPLKALCEQAVERAMTDRTLVIRPGLIVGPNDPTDRFTYWPWRLAQGGEVLAPGRPDRNIQFIDARDLAEWIVQMVERATTGIYNADGPDRPLTMWQLLAACRNASGTESNLTWVSEEFLAEQEVGAWMEMPLWIPESDPDSAGFFAIDCRKAIDAGLRFRSVDETVRATLAWTITRPEEQVWRAGISLERETDLLRAWHEANG